MLIILLTAASVGLVHTVIGPDHYVPFIAIAKARHWNKLKTLIIVTLCGMGHILSSVVIGFGGIALGIAISSIKSMENSRGTVAAWLLIAFGILYTLWGLRQAYRNKKHTHIHFHEDGSSHEHNHSHAGGHLHVHVSDHHNITPWVLFIIFVFGPCEPLIPLVMYPAASGKFFEVFLVCLIFGSITIAVMLTMTFMALYGLSLVPMEKIEKYTHVLAGSAILLCGLGIKILGL